LEILRVFEAEALPTCIDYSPDGRFLSVANRYGTIFIYEVEKNEWVSTLLVSETDKLKPKISM
jgi:WD40 repeat protein